MSPSKQRKSDRLLGLLAGIVTIICGFLTAALSNWLGRKYSKSKIRSITPGSDTSNSLTELTTKLHKISSEVDNATHSLSLDIKNRQNALDQLIEKNKSLATEEANLNAKISVLKDVPLEVADYFKIINEDHLKKFERRNGKRDMIMFFLGIVATTIVSIIIAFFIK